MSMLAILIVLGLSAQQPSNPSPPSPHEKIVAILPKEIEIVDERAERLLKKLKNNWSVGSGNQKSQTTIDAKRQYKRRGLRNH